MIESRRIEIRSISLLYPLFSILYLLTIYLLKGKECVQIEK